MNLFFLLKNIFCFHLQLIQLIFLKDVEREIDHLEYISACGAFVDEYLNKFYLLRKYLFKQKLENKLEVKNTTKKMSKI